jgi:hypothetical protein
LACLTVVEHSQQEGFYRAPLPAASQTPKLEEICATSVKQLIDVTGMQLDLKEGNRQGAQFKKEPEFTNSFMGEILKLSVV